MLFEPTKIAFVYKTEEIEDRYIFNIALNEYYKINDKHITCVELPGNKRVCIHKYSTGQALASLTSGVGVAIGL